MPLPQSRPSKKMVTGAQKGRKAKIEPNSPQQLTPYASLGANNTKSLQEMKAFIAQMQLKYNPAGPTTTATLTDNSFQSFSDKLIEDYFGLNTKQSSKFLKYLDLATCPTGNITAFPPPATLPAMNAERQEEEEMPVADPPTRCIISNNCVSSCAEVAEEAASLKVLLAEMQRQHLELRKDLEEYAATTGAMLASMQGQLKRWNNTGGDSGNKHGGQY